MLERCVDLSGRGATVSVEIRGGVTTFMAAAFVVCFAMPLVRTLRRARARLLAVVR